MSSWLCFPFLCRLEFADRGYAGVTGVTDYKQRGDGFRDDVAAVLRLAGFEAEAEVRADHTKVDVVSLLQRDPFRGDTRIFLEAKHTNGNLGVDTAAEFAGKYASLVVSRQCDEAWLISRHPLTPDAKKLVDGYAGLRAMDFAALQGRLMDFGGYLRALLDAYDASGIGSYYVPPHDRAARPLEGEVRAWLAKPAAEAPPLAVIGRYGIGKSTFARHLTARLAAEAQADPSSRVPILVPLGEVFDDQSLEGLLGKVLASRVRVGNYNFGLFEKLNAAGRFVVVFDGFDEMKHGLTPDRFERNMRELLRLDAGEAKLLFLGRDTAFHSAEEFDRVVLGRQRTGCGAVIPTRDRRALEPVHVEDFRPEDVRSFVTRYLPLRARQDARTAHHADWVEARVAEVLSSKFDELLARPVHAQMLCDIASRPEAALSGLTKHGLYDQFVHYLLDREVGKRDMAVHFGVEVRRGFNAMVAWWLWCRDQRNTTTLGEIPQALVDKAVERSDAELRGEELRRALVIGCLVEKGGDNFYFSHRSVQEFLVAEHLANTDLLAAESEAEMPLRLLGLVTTDIQDFLAERLAMPGGPAMAERWLKALPRLQGTGMEPGALGLFMRAAQVAPPGGAEAWAGKPWSVLLKYFAANGECAFAPRVPHAVRVLADAHDSLRQKHPPAAHAAALLLCARCLRSGGEVRPADVTALLAAWLPMDVLRDNGRMRVDDVRARQGVRIQFRKSDDFRMWAFLRAAGSERQADGSLTISVDLRRLEADMAAQLGFGFSRPEGAVGVHRVSAASVLGAMGELGSRDFELEPVRRFWNVPGGFAARFHAVEVEAGRAVPAAEKAPLSPYRGSERIGRRRPSRPT